MDISRFTPQFKDEILTKICENIPPYTLPTSFIQRCPAISIMLAKCRSVVVMLVIV